jgi:hypothetical protein
MSAFSGSKKSESTSEKTIAGKSAKKFSRLAATVATRNAIIRPKIGLLLCLGGWQKISKPHPSRMAGNDAWLGETHV